MRHLMEADPDAPPPSLAVAFWLAAFVLGFIVWLSVLLADG